MPDANRGARDAWVLRVLKFDVAADGARAPLAPGQRASAPPPGLRDALGTWVKSRAGVLDVLKRYETAIRGFKDPLSDPAIILVKAIAANITAAPVNRNQVTELRRYLATDSIVDDAESPNGFGIDVKIRAPLIAALDILEPALPA